MTDTIKIGEYAKSLENLIKILIEEDPNEGVSDGGHTVLDLWRHDATKALDRKHFIEQEQPDLDWLEAEIEKIPVRAEVNSMKGVGPDFATTSWISKQDVLDLIEKRRETKS